MDRSYTTYDGDQIVDQGSTEVTWAQVRWHRDRVLAETDWRAVKDRTMSQAWKDYRTALRDLPQDYPDANTACDNWPEAPE